MNRSRSAGILFVLTALTSSMNAQEPPKTNGPKLLTPEASLNLRSISDLQFSPDGNRLAFVVTEPAKGERRARHIWLYEKQSGVIRQFTHSAKSELLPRWSSDGKQLAFLSDRDEQQQIYAMRADGGEASALTKGKRGVKNFAWSPDGKKMAFLAPTQRPKRKKRKKKTKTTRMSRTEMTNTHDSGCLLSTLEKPRPSPNLSGISAKPCGIHPAPA